jgi:hypothetical protein
VSRAAGVAIGFGGRQVVVESDDGALLAKVGTIFEAMSPAARDRRAPRLAVRRRADGYVVTGQPESPSPAESMEDALRRVRYEVVLRLIEARSDLLWLHAAAAAHGRGALLIVGPGGAGKSTLVTALLAHGFRYLGDDVVPVDLGTGRVVPFPAAPAVRQGPGRWLPPGDVTALPRTGIRVPRRLVARAPVGVAALVFPRYVGEGPSAIEPCPPGEAALRLLEHSLNFSRHRARAVRWACGLAAGRPTYRLRHADAPHATELLTDLVS